MIAKRAISLALLGMMTSSAAYAEAGDWLVRARAIWVAPTEDSSGVLPLFPNGGVGVGNAVAPELDFTYFVTRNLGVEVILGTTRHNITGKGDLAGLGKLADSRVLPPTITLQYHFAPEANIRPYMGVGLNYTLFYDRDASPALNGALGNTRVRLSDSWGYALQAGVDIQVTGKVFLNFDVKYIDMDTTATLRSSGNLTNRVDVDINPVVIGVGFGMRF